MRERLGKPRPKWSGAAPPPIAPSATRRDPAPAVDSSSPTGAWADTITDYENKFVLRELIIKTGHGFKDSCRKDWYVYVREGGERKVVPVSCNERGHCPACAVAYGERAAGELVSVIKAALELRKRPLVDGDKEVLTFNPTVTYPAEVQAELTALCERGLYPGRQLTKLQDMEKRLLARFVFKTRPDQMTAHVAWHWWNSANPLSGKWYWHAHLMIPNVTITGQKLRHEGVIPLDRLRAYKRAKFSWLAQHYPEAMRKFAAKFIAQGTYRVWEKLNFHIYFILNDQHAKVALRDAAEYDTRHPLKDLLKAVVNHQLWDREDAIGAFVARCRWLQTRKKLRYFGWLRPGKRSEVGIVQVEEDSGPRWSLDFNAYRTLERFVARGALFRRYGPMPGQEDLELFHAQEIRLNALPSRRWRREVKGGPSP